jgi:RNA polymerase sigma-70 factor (ECF subfamily)
MDRHLDLTRLTDAALVARVRDGDVDAPWEELDRRYREQAIDIAYAIVRFVWPQRADEAADIAQEALVQVYRILDRYDGRAFLPWLAAVVRSRAIDRLRRLRKRPADRRQTALLGSLDDTLPGREPLPVEALARQEIVQAGRQRLRDEMARLSARERDCLIRFHVSGQGVDELAADLHVAVQTVRILLSRSKKKLLTQLGGARLTNRELGEVLACQSL